MSDEQLATKLKQIVQEIADVATAGLRSDRVEHLERTIRIVYNILQSERKEAVTFVRRIEPTDEERAAAERWRHDRSVDRDKDSPYAGFGPYGTFIHEDKRKRDVDTLAAYAARVLTETADGR